MADFAGRTRRSTPELSLSDALFLAQNAAELEKLRAEWAEREAGLDAKIALAGAADDILRLREEAQADRREASETANAATRRLREANAERDRIVTAAQNEAASILATARDQADTVIAAAAAKERHAAETLGQAESTRAEVEAAKATLAPRETALAEGQADLERGTVAVRAIADDLAAHALRASQSLSWRPGDKLANPPSLVS